MTSKRTNKRRVALNSLILSDVRERVEDIAAQEQRSLSNTVELLLQEAIRQRDIDTEQA